MPVTVVGLGLLAVLLLVPLPRAYARARWVVREPRAALVLWQALGLAAGLAAVGGVLAAGVAPLGGTVPEALGAWAAAPGPGGIPTGLGPGSLVALASGFGLLTWLLSVTAVSVWRTWRSRDRQRELVDLVSTPWPPRNSPVRASACSARVIDHPAPAAYCLPGQGTRVVVTTGALALLRPEELDAVLAHEHAHLAERHDLVLLPFAAWATALPWLGGPRQARGAVGQLVEMVADDRACVGRDRAVLAAALARVGVSTAPAGALASTEHALLPRVRRLLDPPMRSAGLRLLAYAGAAAVLGLPSAVVFLPAF